MTEKETLRRRLTYYAFQLAPDLYMHYLDLGFTKSEAVALVYHDGYSEGVQREKAREKERKERRIARYAAEQAKKEAQEVASNEQ